MKRFLRAVKPRRPGLIVALLGIGGAVAYGISGQTPVGTVTGRVYLAETHAGIGDVHVVLTPRNEDDEDDSPYAHRRTATSRPDGSFLITNVPAGGYDVAAYTGKHAV